MNMNNTFLYYNIQHKLKTEEYPKNKNKKQLADINRKEYNK